jgi:hypothetical protein
VSRKNQRPPCPVNLGDLVRVKESLNVDYYYWVYQRYVDKNQVRAILKSLEGSVYPVESCDYGLTDWDIFVKVSDTTGFTFRLQDLDLVFKL